MSSITYNAELNNHSCYCGRFDGAEWIDGWEMTDEGECYSCIELSKNEDLNDEMDRQGEKVNDALELMDLIQAEGDDFANLPEEQQEWLMNLGYIGRKMVREWCVAKLNELIKNWTDEDKKALAEWINSNKCEPFWNK